MQKLKNYKDLLYCPFMLMWCWKRNLGKEENGKSSSVSHGTE
jgi:hypothetical protein